MQNLLLVIHDSVEYRLLLSNVFIKNHLSKYKVTVACPVAADSTFRKKVEELIPDVSFLDYYPDNAIGSNIEGKDYKALFNSFVYYYLKLNAFYSQNFKRSPSAYQKLSSLFGFSVESILENRHKFLKNILFSILAVIFFPFRTFLYRTNPYIVPVNRKKYEKFDKIIFGRPNSISNITIYFNHKKAGKKTEVETLCRNFDTPALKGVYTVVSDKTLYFDAMQKQHIQSLLDIGFSGKLEKISYYIKPCIRVAQNTKFRFVFATAQPSLISNQSLFFELSYYYLLEHCKIPFEYVLRVHPTDSVKNYDIAGKRSLIVDKEISTFYKNFSGNNQSFYIGDGFLNSLKTADVLVTPASTVVYDAKLLGVRCAFLNLDRKYDVLYEREHLQGLHKKNIPILKDYDEFYSFIEDLCKP